MNFSEIKQYKIVILLALVFLVCAGSLFVFSAYSHPEELQKPPQQDLQPTPGQSPVPSSTERLHYDYCIIEEVHPDFLKVIPDFVNPNATIVHLSSDDLEPFPEYQKQMADESKLSKKWRDGHRFIGDFIDFQRQFDDFRNLTCKHSPDPVCNSRQSSVYEYNGRYFTVGCLPDFGGGHQNLPPPRK
jgi:hypothetical protein